MARNTIVSGFTLAYIICDAHSLRDLRLRIVFKKKIYDLRLAGRAGETPAELQIAQTFNQTSPIRHTRLIPAGIQSE